MSPRPSEGPMLGDNGSLAKRVPQIPGASHREAVSFCREWSAHKGFRTEDTGSRRPSPKIVVQR